MGQRHRDRMVQRDQAPATAAFALLYLAVVILIACVRRPAVHHLP